MPIRYVLLMGPWRPLIVALLRAFVKNPPVATNKEPLFNGVDVSAAARQLEVDGFAGGLRLAPAYVQEIINDPRSKQRLINPHNGFPAIDKIARNSQVVEIARRYLGVGPSIHSAGLEWTHPAPDDSSNGLRPAKVPFHYDVADFKSLTLFLYLTDVDTDSCPHSVIVGTHNHKKARELLKRRISEEEARRRYEGRFKVITGPSGTAFCEDVVAYHRRMGPGKKSRLILRVNYVIARRRQWKKWF